MSSHHNASEYEDHEDETTHGDTPDEWLDAPEHNDDDEEDDEDEEDEEDGEEGGFQHK
jgi:hypothetical protein